MQFTSKTKHFLISIKWQYACLIFTGVKKFELRRKPVNIPHGSALWIYVPKPHGHLLGVCKVGNIRRFKPDYAWDNYNKDFGINKKDYDAYFEGSKEAVMIELTEPQVDADCFALTLDYLRKVEPTFTPPQQYCNLDSKSDFVDFLKHGNLMTTKQTIANIKTLAGINLLDL